MTMVMAVIMLVQYPSREWWLVENQDDDGDDAYQRRKSHIFDPAAKADTKFVDVRSGSSIACHSSQCQWDGAFPLIQNEGIQVQVSWGVGVVCGATNKSNWPIIRREIHRRNSDFKSWLETYNEVRTWSKRSTRQDQNNRADVLAWTLLLSP